MMSVLTASWRSSSPLVRPIVARLLLPAASVTGATVASRPASSDALTSYKRGRGGRSSFSGNVVTVFGASGYLGRYVMNRLGKTGCQVIIPYRCDPYDVQRLKLCGDLGQILYQPFDLRDEESIKRSMKYSNVVINLIGKDFETKNFKFDDVNVKGPRLIAKCAAESNVNKLIHISHVNASPNPQSVYIKGGSKFLKSKYAGEMAVREEFPNAIVFRPSDIFGSEDRFLTYYARWWRRLGNRLPLFKKGTQTIKQPVFVSNVAEGIVNAMNDPLSLGKTYDAVGPNRYYLSDLIDFMIKIMRNPDIKRSNMNPLFLAKMQLHSFAPNDPILHLEKLELESITDIVSENPNLADLGVKLLPIEDRAAFELKPYRFFNYYMDRLGEFPDPSPPPVVH